jgi:hypothetical protein
VYRIPITAKVVTSGDQKEVPSGKRGRANRTSPYVPSFRSRAARRTEPIVGASTCASGSQM